MKRKKTEHVVGRLGIYLATMIAISFGGGCLLAKMPISGILKPAR